MLELKKVITLPKMQRFMSKLNLGTEDISDIGDGSLKGAIRKTNDTLDEVNTNLSGMGKYIQWGKYGREWQLTNTYGNIGSTLPAVNDDLYSSTTGNIASVTVKKAGTYLVNFNGSYTGNSVVWAQLAIGSATEFEYTTQCNSYASLNFSRILHLEAGQRVTINISGASGYVVKSDGKELAQVLCLSLD